MSFACAGIALLATPFAGCRRAAETAPATRLVVYCSVDSAFARPLLEAYRTRSGVGLAVVFDSEAGKTTGLVNRIIREAQAGRPRADVFWSSEVFNTILLARDGLLEPYESPAAKDIPPRFKDPLHRWTAFGLRARVLAFDPKRTPRETVPKRWEALAEPRVAGRLALANPLFGTTRGHVAAMFALWGAERGRRFLERLRDGGVRIVDGNSAAVRAVVTGRAAFAATDTDDVWMARRNGASLDLVYPDMGDGGTLMIPCSVGVIKAGPEPAAARRLVDFLVSAEVEKMLSQSESRNVPVRTSLGEALGVSPPPASRVDLASVADAMDEAVAAVRDILIR